MSIPQNNLLFDLAASAEAAEAAIAQVKNNANEYWGLAAVLAGERVARRRQFFTTDDIWAELAEKCVRTHEPRAMGAIMRGLMTAGICRPTDRITRTARVVAHCRPLRVWESLVYF